MSAAKWTRFAPGLYVDPSKKWVVTRDDRAYYTVRVLLGYGACLDGVTMMPDYGSIHYGTAYTLADTKALVESYDWFPENDSEITLRALDEVSR